ncbi:MAG: HAD-IC family P-type ATPase, partial [bacterium]
MNESVYKHLIIRILAILFGMAIAGVLYGGGSAHWATQLVTAIILVGTIPIVIEMTRSIRQRKIGLDVVALTAIIASVVLGELLAGVVILLMLTGGEALEAYAQKSARKELDALLRRAPIKTHRVIGSQISEISVAQIQPGFQLQIKPGETIPVDGRVVRGRSSLDESSLTGESLPIKIGPKDEILSGAINQDGVIIMIAAKTSQTSQYQQIISLVREAASERSPFVRLADEMSVPFTVLSFTIAGLAWWLTGQPMRAFEVLVVATPCPLLIATPVAIVAGMSRAARRGIIVKNGGALETMARLKSLTFDKTGTL